MGKIISFVAQKGGVGKSTLARAIAREAATNGWSVKIADLDTQQGTVSEWHRLRLANEHEPVGSVELIAKASTALTMADDFDLLVLDSGARASEATAVIAQNLILLFYRLGQVEMTLSLQSDWHTNCVKQKSLLQSSHLHLFGSQPKLRSKKPVNSSKRQATRFWMVVYLKNRPTGKLKMMA